MFNDIKKDLIKIYRRDFWWNMLFKKQVILAGFQIVQTMRYENKYLFFCALMNY